MTTNIDAHTPPPPDEPEAQTLSPNRVRVHLAGVTVDIELNPTNAPTARPSPAPLSTREPTPAPAPAEPTVEHHYVRSPIVGTFYQAPDPGSAPFVAVGDSVAEGQQIGIVEAMKLMNRIDADMAGKVVEILAPDATPVEYDSPLIALDPE